MLLLLRIDYNTGHPICWLHGSCGDKRDPAGMHLRGLRFHLSLTALGTLLVHH